MFGGQSKTVGKLGALACAVAAAGVFLGTTRTAAADSINSINIIINTSGAPGYYQINGGTWETFSASSAGWDSMSSTPGGSASTPTRNTDYFPVSNLNDGVNEVNNTAWQAGPNDTSGSQEGALILTQGGTAAGSSVSNLLVLDGTGGIYLYNAPTLTAGATNTSSPVNTYGYTGNGSTHFDPGVGTPITELGGLQSDLQFNGGMAGNGNGTNIVAGAQQLITDPRTGLTVEGYAFTSPTELRLQTDNNGGTFLGYVSPTIYVETVPLPAAAWSGLSLMVGLGGFFAVSKRFRRVPRIA